MERASKGDLSLILLTLSWIGFAVVVIGTKALMAWVQHYYATTHNSAPYDATLMWLKVLLGVSGLSAAGSVGCLRALLALPASLTKVWRFIAGLVALVANLGALFWVYAFYIWA